MNRVIIAVIIVAGAVGAAALWDMHHLPPQVAPCRCQFDPARFVHDVDGYGWMIYRDEKRTVFTRVHIDTVYVASGYLGEKASPDTIVLPR